MPRGAGSFYAAALYFLFGAMNAKPYLRSISLKRDTIQDAALYPFTIPAVRKLDTLAFHPDVTFLVGENGTGKSTLLEAVAVAWGFNAEGGTKNFTFSTRASHSELHRHLKLIRSFRRPRDGFFLRAESYFNVATNIEEMDREGAFGNPLIDAYGGRSLHEQSHGESFMALVMERFRGDGFYILDEPEAALSPMRQVELLRRIHELVTKRSQFVIATHSPMLLAYPSARIFVLTDQGYTETAYQDTEHYLVSRDFLNNPAQALNRIMGD